MTLRSLKTSTLESDSTRHDASKRILGSCKECRVLRLIDINLAAD